VTETSGAAGPPKSILLATDLSPRCDRALDRALALSRQWQAKLVILHVLETAAPGRDEDPAIPSWRRPPDPASVALRQLLADVGPPVENARIVVAEGDPADTVAQVADENGCDLVVTGIARDEMFGRILLGDTVERLLRRSRTPLLIARERARHPYRQVAVATDFSDVSRHALQTAGRWFPGQAITVVHAYDAPMSGLAADPDGSRRRYRRLVMEDYAAFVASLEPGEGLAARLRPLIEFGRPADVLRQGVRDLCLDLVVLGTRGRGALLEALIGSVAKEILGEVRCDALVVREPAVPTGPEA
jgi:nucleotide-binding universal stress UspA family protein